MGKFARTLLSAGLSAIMLAGALLPAEAMPLAKAPAGAAHVELVQWGPPGPGYDRRDYRDYRRPPRDHYDRRPPRGDGWYNGHRGYRDRRAGHRYHNGYWYPMAAFAAGAIIGGAIAAPPAPRAAPSAGINPKHYDWCASRYRSYRSYDNTFQPNYGARQQCYSPFF